MPNCDNTIKLHLQLDFISQKISNLWLLVEEQQFNILANIKLVMNVLLAISKCLLYCIAGPEMLLNAS